MIRTEIRREIQRAARAIFGGVSLPHFSVEVPENPAYGDYATNAALLLAGATKKPPMDIARLLVAQLATDLFERVISVPPGFINFWLTSESLHKELAEVLRKGKNYGAGPPKKDRVNIEFVSANPTGPLHLGHGRGAFLGDALANVLGFYGMKIVREYYVNDAKVSAQIKELGKTALGRGTTYLTPELKKIISGLRTKIAIAKRKKPENLTGEIGWLVAEKIQKRNKMFLEKKLKIKFDVFFSEESLYAKSEINKTLALLKDKNLVYEKDGALWFKSKEFGDSEDRVLLRTGGEPTYFLPDLAYHLDKIFTRKFDKVIDIWGADHHGYARRLAAALSALGVPKEKLEIIITQLVRLIKGGTEVKMSKRKGEFVTLEELIDEVGPDAARFFFLMHSPDSHMDFDLELAKERSQKNPVYYAQYAHARIVSILKKAEGFKNDSKKIDLLVADEERSLIKKLIRFPEIVEDTSRDYQVIRLTRYATELARAFHDFYEKHRVITDNKELTSARLTLIKAVRIVLQNVLGLLGISAPEKM